MTTRPSPPSVGALLKHHDRRPSDAVPAPRSRSRYIAAVRQPVPPQHAMGWGAVARFYLTSLAAGLLVLVALLVWGTGGSLRQEPMVELDHSPRPLLIVEPSFHIDPIRVQPRPVVIAPVVAPPPVSTAAVRSVAPPPASAGPFASATVPYVPVQSAPSPSGEPVNAAYRIASIASADLVLIASTNNGTTLVTPYRKGDRLPDGRTIVAIDTDHARVVTSGDPIGRGI